MRWLAAALAAFVVLSGCASPKAEPAAEDLSSAAELDAMAPEGNATIHLMRFAGGDQEASMPFELTFAATDPCIFTGNICSTNTKRVDLTSVIPGAAPVELSIELSGPGNYGMYLETSEATVLRYSSDYDSGTYRLDASLVRASAGTVTLAVSYYVPSVDSAPGMTLTGLAHSVARSDVVPAFVPVAIELGPGDLLNATGDGLEQFVLFPPKGEPLRAVLKPFVLRVPDDYPTGTYLAVAAADEAVRLRGPSDRTLTAHLLVFIATEPIDVAIGQETTWEMPLDAHPLHVGLTLRTKPTVDGSAVAAYPGNFDVKVVSPGNVDVLAENQDCTVFITCGMAVLGYSSYGYVSDLLDEHLVTGTYKGSVTMESGRDMQAYSWAVVIR